jgi:hypothetical protein
MSVAEYPGAAPPPDGVEPNIEHPEDVLQTILYVTQGLTVFFVTVFVGLRMYAKTKLLGNILTWDDCKSRRLLGVI